MTQELLDYIEKLEEKLEKAEDDLNEIRIIVGYPGSIELKKHGLSDRLPDIVRYSYREWLAQTHMANIRVINAESELDKTHRFHDHIKAHFEKEHPDWQVVCKMCGKTYAEIVNDKEAAP